MAYLQAGLFGQRRLGTHSYGQQHHVAMEHGAGRGGYRDGVSIRVLVELGYTIGKMQGNAVRGQVILDRHGHLRVDRRHHLRQHLDDGDGDAPPDQVLGGFQADEPAADNHGLLHLPLGDPLLHLAAVRDRPQREYAGEVDAGQWGADRC